MGNIKGSMGVEKQPGISSLISKFSFLSWTILEYPAFILRYTSHILSSKLTSRPPNILFFFPDQHRPDWLGYNQQLPLRTPNLDWLCKHGIRFSNAFTPSPLCAPARACLATGRGYHRCGVRDNGQNTPLNLANYYHHLRNAGYQVAGTGKFDLHKPDLDWGLDGSKMLEAYGFSEGIDNEGKGDAIVAYHRNKNSPKGPYMQYLKDKGLIKTHLAMYEPYMGKPDWLNFPAVTSLPDEAYCDNWVSSNAIQFLKEFPHETPWHLVVNFVGPHGPFDVTPEMRETWKEVEIPPPFNNQDEDLELIQKRRQNYAAMIENIDTQIGRMIYLVYQRGELENTVIVYSSDHGEMLGDHGLWGKSVWYRQSVGIPLVISGPGVRQGRQTDAMVSLQDVAATLLDFAGADPLPGSDSISLRNILLGESDYNRMYVHSGLNEWDMVFDGQYKLVTGYGPSPILYDTRDDPLEMDNLADRNPQIVDRLKRLIEYENNPERKDL